MSRALPDTLPVLNCAGCGRLMTRSRTSASIYGIRLWGGSIAGRPNCTDCLHERYAPESAIAPEKFRSSGQVAKLATLTGLHADAAPRTVTEHEVKP